METELELLYLREQLLIEINIYNHNLINQKTMGLLDMLLNQGSPLSIANGAAPTINPLATNQSTLHADGDQPGYSLNGNTFTQVNNAWAQYVDGYANTLPQPSQLDLDGQTPPRYLDNLPE
jgi:hypothetical protein